MRTTMQDYLDNEADPSLPRRLASQSILPNSSQYQVPNYHGMPRGSTRTSMLLSGSTRTRGSLSTSQDLPALTTPSSRSTAGSVASSMGMRALANQRILDVSDADGGALVLPQVIEPLECPFNFLLCSYAFTSFEDWFRHSLSHFRHVGPPKANQCCFCDMPFNSLNGLRSWQDRMEHIAYVHHQHGHRLAHARPDFQLYKYLWDQRLISDADYRDLKGNNEVRSRAAQAYPSPPVSPSEASAITITHRPGTRGRHGR